MSFRHMQVMFTSSTGKVLESNPFCLDAGIGGTTVHGDGNENIIRRKVRSGEKITYLYRFFPLSQVVFK